MDSEYERKTAVHESHSNILSGVVQVSFGPSNNGSTRIKVFSVCAVVLQAFNFLVTGNTLWQYAEVGE